METLEQLKTGSPEKAAMASMYDQTFQNFEEGSVIEGTVVAVKKDAVIVDIGYKSEGIISAEEFTPQELAALTPGTRLPVYIEEREDSEGNLILSKEKADKMKVWEDLERIYKEEAIVEGRIISRIKGGMMVDIGVKAFLPGSQIDLHPVRDPEQLIGKTFPMKIIKINQRRGNVVVSRRLLLEESRDQRRQRTLANLTEGQLVNGTIKNITDYGAFVDLGGMEGLVHVSEMSWSHEVRHPSKIVSVGAQVEAQVLNVDEAARKISLGMKQVAPNPWDLVETKYPIGTKIEGKVKSLTDFGAFVGLDEGVDGLIHISDMSWTKHVKHPSEIFKKGQQVEAIVLKIDKEKERLSLGYKQLTSDPWEDAIPKAHQVGNLAHGKINKITDFGIFVELDSGVEGLIHVSELGLEQNTRMEDKFKIGEDIEAKVIKVDKEERKIALSLREQHRDTERQQMQDFHAGQDKVDQSLGRAAKKNKRRDDNDQEE